MISVLHFSNTLVRGGAEEHRRIDEGCESDAADPGGIKHFFDTCELADTRSALMSQGKLANRPRDAPG